jgi:hypothetical protein
MLALSLLSGTAQATRPATYELRCNSESHGIARGGPWAKVGGPYRAIRQCEKAMPGHRDAAHGGDISVVLQCVRV